MPRLEEMPTVDLFNFKFHSAEDYSEVIEFLCSDRKLGEGKIPMVITPNVDQVVKFNRKEYHSNYTRLQDSAIMLPDGQPIVWTSKLKYGKDGIKTRLTGCDLFPPLWKELRAKNKRVFFILADDSLGKKFQTEYDNCSYYAPPYFQLDDPKSYGPVLEAAKEAIDTFNPEHVFVGIGFPKQETIALDLFDHFPMRQTYYYMLGATFEFYFGKKSRAPQWMQNSGLEFLHRMITEPGRMIKRYLIDDAAFIPILFKELRTKR